MMLADQIRDMRRKFPGFELTYSHSWMACWEGSLTPIAKCYRIRIRYVFPRRFDDFYIKAPYHPSVQLLEPKLSIINSFPGAEPLQHIFQNCDHPELSTLCLDDPIVPQWSWDRSIADTIVPWVIDWLVCYEFWHATGKWKGGGRHLIAMEEPCPTPQHQALSLNLDLSELFFNGEYLGIGQKVVNLEFSALTAAVYEAFSQQLFLQNLKSDFYTQGRGSTNASILSPALPQAA